MIHIFAPHSSAGSRQLALRTSHIFAEAVAAYIQSQPGSKAAKLRLYQIALSSFSAD